MKLPDSERPGASDADDTGRGIFEVRARRVARWALIASLVLMAAIVIFMLARGEAIPAEAWFVAVVWAGWVIYTLRAMGHEKRL